MSIRTPPPTSLSDPPSPTELQTPDEEPEMLSPSAKRIIKTTTTVITPIFMRPEPIFIIVATSLNPPMGIGNQGKLPWPSIKADMAFFKEVTSYVPARNARGTRSLNAVVMGRKTWESIPAKFRPLAGRLNVIITRGSSSELGKRIIEDMKARSKGGADSPSWEMHQLPPAKVNSRPKSRSAAQVATTVLVPSPSLSSSSPEHSLSPILISQSVPAVLAILSSPGNMSFSSGSSTPTSAPSTQASSQPELPLSIHKIFCIGGAEIYRQVLALSSHAPQTPTTPTRPGAGTGSETNTETDTDEGELSSSAAANSPRRDPEHFDVRILQTQIRKHPDPNHARSELERRTSKVDIPDFECDAFFPDLLPSPGSRVKSGKWKPVAQEKLQAWIGEEVELPQHAGRRKQSIQVELPGAIEEGTRAVDGDDDDDEDDSERDGFAQKPIDDVHGKELWLQDEKVGVEIRVVAWERR